MILAIERPLGVSRSVTIVREAIEFFRYPIEQARKTIQTRKKTVSSEDQIRDLLRKYRQIT
jgi:delta 1-pyrroline-5-carboxylate dehydrogenase